MPDLVVIVPSRGRSNEMRDFTDAFFLTATADTELLVVLDDDDPRRDEYVDYRYTVLAGPHHSMVEAVNNAAAYTIGPSGPFAVGFMGDDHRPRTEGWDKRYLDTLREMKTGIVYGDDLLQGENLPTQVAMTSDIVTTLRFMIPPSLTHLFVDNFWRDLGRNAGCLRYLPEIVIEHMHPTAGKAAWDEGHIRVNTPEMYAKDANAYTAYMRRRMWTDVAAIKTLRGAR